MRLAPINDIDLAIFSRNWIWFLAFGILIEILGLLALFSLVTATLVSTVLLGALLIISGTVVIISCFITWRHSIRNFILHLLLGALYCSAGFLLVKAPLVGSLFLTFLLGLFFIMIGLFRMLSALVYRYPHWGWLLINGLVTLALGLLIMSNWPLSGLYIIGLFIGIDLLFCGWAYIMGAVGAHQFLKKN